jgi:DNA repair exonuclease SbcCD ATPase subunit
MKGLELVQMEGLEAGFFNWIKNIFKKSPLYKAGEWTYSKAFSAIKKAKQDLLEIKQKIDTIFQKFPYLKIKYPEYEELTQESQKYLSAKVKMEGFEEGLEGAVTMLIVGGAIVGVIGIATYLKRMQNLKQKYLNLYEQIMNDPSLSPSQKESMIKAIQQKSSGKASGLEGIAWVIGLVIAFIIVLIGVSLFGRTR